MYLFFRCVLFPTIRVRSLPRVWRFQSHFPLTEIHAMFLFLFVFCFIDVWEIQIILNFLLVYDSFGLDRCNSGI
jgi:hypothetical protein